MTQIQDTLSQLEQICQQQFEEIENKKLQIWDLEEEVRVLQEGKTALEQTLEAKAARVDDLERWCAHLQAIIDAREARTKKLEKRFGIFYKLARKLARIFVR